MEDKGRVQKKEDGVVNYPPPGRVDADEFGRAISKIAVTQICQSIGFEGFKDSALESLADIVIRYLRDLGRSANSYANLAGRTECNVFDVMRSLEELSLSAGYFGASDIGHCVVDTPLVREIIDYVESAQEIPFVQPVPQFPVTTERKPIPSFLQMGEIPEHKNIPDWLPAFPDRHTYVHTPVWNERLTDPREDKINLAKQRRKAERSLLSLQQRLLSTKDKEASTSSSMQNHLVDEQIDCNGVENPFHLKPLQAGEENVSATVVPDRPKDKVFSKDHVSLLDTFAPAIEAMKDGNLEIESDMQRNHPDKRPAVCLELKYGKKFMSEPLDLRLMKKVPGKTAPWFGRDGEKNDKNRRAEFILRQSMENQAELTQL